jgi:hypothetical protein
MKAKSILFVAFMSLFLSSCYVKSLHPFYKENNLYFDKKLIGIWTDKDSSQYTVKQIYVSFGEGEQKKEYRNDGYVVSVEPKELKSNPPFGALKKFDVFLFKLNEQIYADFSQSLFPGFSFDEYDIIRGHSLARVVLSDNEIQFNFFNGEWLANLIETNKIRISHEFVEYPKPVSLKYKGEYILTASTDDLQKFILKYGNDPKAFDSTPNKLEDGKYQWNAGCFEMTGVMTFGKNKDINKLILKRKDEK